MADIDRARLLFFSDTLQPLRPCADADLARQLAGYLTAGGDRVWADSVRAVWQPGARLHRAATLLRRLLVAQQQRTVSLETWHILQGEWAWVRSSADVHALLTKHAAEKGIEAPATVVDEVLAAVDTELLPLARLRGALLGAARGSVGDEFAAVLAWHIPDVILPQIGSAYLLLLSTGAAAAMCVPDAVHDNVRRLLPSAVRQKFAAALISAYTAIVARDPRPAGATVMQCNKLLQKVGEIERMAPADADLLLLLAELHIATGAARINADDGEDIGVELIARAGLLNPFSDTARKHLDKCVELRRSLGQQFEELRPRLPEPVAGPIRARLKRYDQGFRRAKDLPSSAAAETIAARWSAALPREFARRNGWNPDEERDLARAETAIEAINEAVHDILNAGGDVTAATVLPRARELADAEGLESDAPWELWLQCLAKAPVWRGELIGLLLDRAPVNPRAEDLAAMVKAARTEGVPGRHGPAFAGAWAFSSADWLPKLAAAAGLVMLLHAAGTGMIAATQRTATDNAYSGFVAAVRSGDHARTIANAGTFLTAARDDDPRFDQVAPVYSEVLFREVLRLSDARRSADAAALLAIYEKVVAAHPRRFDSNQDVAR